MELYFHNTSKLVIVTIELNVKRFFINRCAVALADAGVNVVLAARNTKIIHKAVDAINEKKLSAEMMVIDLSDISLILINIKNIFFKIIGQFFIIKLIS